MAKVSGNELVVRALLDEEVDTAFYLTGGPIVDVARGALQAGIRCVDTRTCPARSSVSR